MANTSAGRTPSSRATRVIGITSSARIPFAGSELTSRAPSAPPVIAVAIASTTKVRRELRGVTSGPSAFAIRSTTDTPSEPTPTERDTSNPSDGQDPVLLALELIRVEDAGL